MRTDEGITQRKPLPQMVSTRLRRVFHFVNNWINVCIYYLVKISYFIDTIIPKKLNAIAIIVIKKIKLELTFSNWSLSLLPMILNILQLAKKGFYQYVHK